MGNFSRDFWPLAYWVMCLPMVQETRVQSQDKSYQRLKKWYLMPFFLTLFIIRYGSRVKWSNPSNGVAPSPTPWCGSYWKGSLQVTLDYGCQHYLLFLYQDLIGWVLRNYCTQCEWVLKLVFHYYMAFCYNLFAHKICFFFYLKTKAKYEIW